MGDYGIRYRFVADVHVGNHKAHGGAVTSGINERCRAILDTLYAAGNDPDGVECLVVLGDLFDVSSPTPQVVGDTMAALDTPDHQGRPRAVRLLLGNHDMVSSEIGDSALVPLLWVNDCMVLDAPKAERLRFPRKEALYFLPFRPEPTVDWFADAVQALHAEVEPGWDREGLEPILCFHAGVRDHNTPKYLWSSPDAIDVDLLFDVMRRVNAKLALCGNWHNHRIWKRDDMTVIQVGALVPTGHDNPGRDYGYVVDIRRGQPSGAPPAAGLYSIKQIDGPRFLTLTPAQLESEGADLPAHTYLRVRLGPGDDENDLRVWIAAAPWAGKVKGLSFVSTGEDTAEQQAEAAEAARTGDTLEKALREYVQAMPLEQGVDRATVEARVLNYLGRA